MFAHPQAAEIHRHVAGRLGCDAEHLDQPGVVVLPSGDLDSSRLIVFERGATTVLVVSDADCDAVRSAVADCDGPLSAEDVCSRLTDLEPAVTCAERVLYLEPSRFTPVRRDGVRPLDDADSTAVTDLHRHCTPLEQRRANVSVEHPAVFGGFVDGRLAAVASFIDSATDAVSDVGVLVHPAYRCHGHGQAVVAALAEWGLEHGRIVQYWRLDTNASSARLAERLNFTEYGRLADIRIRPS
jgi:GNAT superfamily N-acetyltransferase